LYGPFFIAIPPGGSSFSPCTYLDMFCAIFGSYRLAAETNLSTAMSGYSNGRDRREKANPIYTPPRIKDWSMKGATQ
jgi:hypothetical protein